MTTKDVILKNEDLSLSSIVEQILSVNPGVSVGTVCFPTPWGQVCIEADTTAPYTKSLSSYNDASNLTLGAEIIALVKQLSLNAKAALNQSGIAVYHGAKKYTVKPTGAFATIEPLDFTISISF